MKGFTLIELLVVVLIIGILASVALPQYQKAVNKSRVAQVLVTLDAVRKADQLFFLQEGKYGLFAGNFEDSEFVGINVPRPNVSFPNIPSSSSWLIDSVGDGVTMMGEIDIFRFGVTKDGEYLCCEGDGKDGVCKELGFLKSTATYDTTMKRCFAL